MGSIDKLKVLSLNDYIMGHITYQNTLEKIFNSSIPEVEFRSLHLTEHSGSDLLGRLFCWLLSRRLPGVGARDSDFIRFRLEFARSFYAIRLLNRVLRTYEPDVLHLHTQAIALLCVRLFQQVPTVVSIDATSALISRIHPFPAPITYKPIIALERRCFHAAKHIITFSDWARKSVIEDYGIPPQKVTTVYPGVPQELFIQATPIDKRKGGKIRLLFVGNDFVRKGGEDLLAVFLEKFTDTCELDIVTNWPLDLPVRAGLRLHRGLRPLSKELL